MSEVDQHFVVAGRAEALDLGILQPGAVQLGADLVEVRRLRELHVDQRAAAELHAERNAVPEQHGSNPATLKISEKARKYHFLPRKSILVLRNNSTASPLNAQRASPR